MARIERICAWCDKPMGWKEAVEGGRPTHAICEECAKAFRRSARDAEGGSVRNAKRRRDSHEELARRAARGDLGAAKRLVKERADRDPGFLKRVSEAFDLALEAMIDFDEAMVAEPRGHLPKDAWVKAQFGKAIVVDGKPIVDGFGDPLVNDAEEKAKEPLAYKEVRTDHYDGSDHSIESSVVVEAAARRLGIESWVVRGVLASCEHDAVDDDGRLPEFLWGEAYGTVEVMEPAGRLRRGGRTLRCHECGSDSDFIEDGRGNVLCSCQACPDCDMVDAYGFHEPGCPRVRDDYDAEGEDE